jgi:Fur family ferric uptake transcriptional regulator
MGRKVEAGADGVGTAWQAELRSRGYRLTPQRQLVLEAVGTIGHATPEEIATAVRATASGVNISTVYRTLELLEELGLVRHAHLGHGAPTYSVAGNDDHVHLVCRDCDAVQEASTDLVAGVVAQLEKEQGFTVDVGHFALFGRCKACSELT